jgi:serine O-acetyltransferase
MKAGSSDGRISEAFGMDLHPAAPIGSGILIDHGTGVVIGETAVVEDSVSLLHEVTLGGTGKESGDRHPKIRRGVLIGAGAKILGNIEVGRGAKVGAGSVVLRDVPPHTTVAGVPARVVGRCTVDEPALEMDATSLSWGRAAGAFDPAAACSFSELHGFPSAPAVERGRSTIRRFRP